MNKLITFLSTFLITLVFTANVAIGADALNRADTEKLIKGNTAEGVNTKWDKKMIWFFHEGGTLYKMKPSGKKGRAEWSLDKKGQLCYQDKHMDESICEPIIPRDDGKYDANDGKWRFDKVLPGNTHNLN